MPSLTEIIHITPSLHTGHIQEASLDLLHTTSQVNGSIADRIKEKFPHLHPKTAGVLVNPRILGSGIPERWSHREAWVGRFLHDTRIIRDPWRVDLKLAEFLLNAGFSESIDILRFFLHAQQRLNHLLEEGTVVRLGILKFGALAYAESRILRRALFEGVYLVNKFGS